ncbi:hypothetical protein LIPSTDRAFT_4552 [Lipomyces starkeyi NRRL Y-11557]|uniref:Xylanolytic transcriptional activator regulatory domain-containing protein n=1 Tax=Lipomyces starkeyi NRRL Y-11557 TaxID=675824 RepID=A0A1E3Q3D7_LIPST|nr:hypothetical protein LIPSTDRAFT_4552 [Lipomyces starkeyi NRRL Y-11557]
MESQVKKENVEEKEKVLGVLSVDSSTGESRYANMAYWGTMFSEEPLVGCLLDQGFRPESPVSHSTSLLSMSTSSGQNILGDLLEFLPGVEQSDLYFYEYLRVVHPFMPFFDRTDLIQRYNQFWANYRRESSFPHFLCVLFMIFYAACMSRSEHLKYYPGESKIRKQNVYQAEMDKYLKATEISLKKCDFPMRPTLLCLVAVTILQTVIHRASTVHNASEVAQLTRVAQLMGMHRDPALFATLSIEPADAKVRRSVWWHLVCLDTHLSISNGLPPTTQTVHQDVKFAPEHVGLEQDKMAQILANGKYAAARILSEQLYEIYGLTKVKQSTFDQLVAATAAFRADMKRRIDVVSSMSFEQRHPESSLELLRKMQRCACLFLELLSSRTCYMLYHPNFENWSAKRIDIVKAAMRVLRLHIEYTRLPDSVEFVWYIRMGQPYHGLMMLLKDIYHRPNDAIDEGESINTGIDGRINIVEETIANIEYLRLNELSSFAEGQWKTILKVKDHVWQALPASSSQPPQSASRYEVQSAKTGDVQGSELDHPTDSWEFSRSGSDKVGIDHPDEQGVEVCPDDVLQQLLNLDSWDIDWATYGFDV